MVNLDLKLAKLWRLRREQALRKILDELSICDRVACGGSLAADINRSLGFLGYLYYKQSVPEATVDQWIAWKADVLAEAKARAKTLRRRVAVLEAMVPPRQGQ